MKIVILTWCCLLLWSATTVYAASGAKDENPYTVRHFTDENGLPQNSVKSIAPDENGFLWLLTEAGFTRFDGMRFHNYSQGNVAPIEGRMFFIASEKGDARLHVLTAKNKMYASRFGRMENISLRPDRYGYMQSDLFEDALEVAVIPDPGLIFEKNTHFIFATAPDACYIVYRDSVFFRKDAQIKHALTIPQLDATRLLVLAGRLCYLQQDGRLLSLDAATEHPLQVTGDQPALKGKPTFYWNPATDQTFVYNNGHCYWWQLLPGGVVKSTLVAEGFNFSHNNIVSLYYDHWNRRLFAGSVIKGLFVITRQQFRTLKHGDQEESYYAQAPFGADGVLSAAGLLFDDRGSREIPLFTQVRTTWDNYSIMRAPDSSYWLKNGGGLFHVDKTLKKVLWKQRLKEDITQLFIDSKNRIWAGGKETGLYMTDALHPASALQLVSAQLKDACYLAEESPDVLWVGAVSGLVRYRISTGKIDTMAALNGKYVRSIYVARPGEVWVSTHNDGIFLVQGSRVTPLPLDNRQYLAAAHCIVPDKKGFFWVTTNKGLFQFNRQDALQYAAGKQGDLYYMYYGRDQGFNTNEFNGGCEPCAVQMGNGQVSLPSLDGLVQFDPLQIRPELPRGKVFIDRIEVDKKPVPLGEHLTLEHHFQQLKLYLSTPYFGDPGNLQLYYALRPHKSSAELLWLPVNSERTLDFSNLSSGGYDLHLRKLGGFGQEAVYERMYAIKVLPAWYQTTWFRIMAALVVSMLVFAFFWWRVHRELLKNMQLERRVIARTLELRANLQQLQRSEEQLRKQGHVQQRLLAAISHDIKTPLQFVLAVLEKSAKRSAELKGEEREAVYDSLWRMSQLVNNMVDYMKAQLLPDAVPVVADIDMLLGEKAAFFRPLAAAKGVELINDIQFHEPVLISRQLLAVVLHNLLDNAVKYTRTGTIHLHMEELAGEMHVHVNDTGTGMPTPLVNWINNYGNAGYEAELEAFTHTGLGLLIVMELLQHIGGRIQVHRRPSGGTAIMIAIRVIRPGSYAALSSPAVL